ncbi:hypothetical protein IMZ48_07890 [Candidatus Bathyarchaeota archaeon]|nr:hypothetical protein [Candidatus Bathyarchaeota archaeon]
MGATIRSGDEILALARAPQTQSPVPTSLIVKSQSFNLIHRSVQMHPDVAYPEHDPRVQMQMEPGFGRPAASQPIARLAPIQKRHPPSPQPLTCRVAKDVQVSSPGGPIPRAVIGRRRSLANSPSMLVRR